MLLRLGLIAVLLGFSHALYFHMNEADKKCFIEEIPDETMVMLLDF